ncbi:unnamed protein product [Closterium sp. Naga37s-1]|nr:unnamed protein product [Closterium sp. Naga37s-1]
MLPQAQLGPHGLLDAFTAAPAHFFLHSMDGPCGDSSTLRVLRTTRSTWCFTPVHFTLHSSTMHAACSSPPSPLLSLPPQSPTPQPPHPCSAFVHNTDYVVFDGFTAADNVWGVNLHQVEGAVVRNLRVVGQTANYGNPWDCTEEWGSGGCAPVSGCNFPLAEGQQGRSVGWGGREEPVYGLVWTQSPWFTDGLFDNVVDGAKCVHACAHASMHPCI